MHIFLWHLLFLTLQPLFSTFFFFSKKYPTPDPGAVSRDILMSYFSSTIFCSCLKIYSMVSSLYTCRLISVVGNYKPYIVSKPLYMYCWEYI